MWQKGHIMCRTSIRKSIPMARTLCSAYNQTFAELQAQAETLEDFLQICERAYGKELTDDQCQTLTALYGRKRLNKAELHLK